jgi:hypothetical protein
MIALLLLACFALQDTVSAEQSEDPIVFTWPKTDVFQNYWRPLIAEFPQPVFDSMKRDAAELNDSKAVLDNPLLAFVCVMDNDRIDLVGQALEYYETNEIDRTWIIIIGALSQSTIPDKALGILDSEMERFTTRDSNGIPGYGGHLTGRRVVLDAIIAHYARSPSVGDKRVVQLNQRLKHEEWFIWTSFFQWLQLENPKEISRNVIESVIVSLEPEQSRLMYTVEATDKVRALTQIFLATESSWELARDLLGGINEDSAAADFMLKAVIASFVTELAAYGTQNFTIIGSLQSKIASFDVVENSSVGSAARVLLSVLSSKQWLDQEFKTWLQSQSAFSGATDTSYIEYMASRIQQAGLEVQKNNSVVGYRDLLGLKPGVYVVLPNSPSYHSHRH